MQNVTSRHIPGSKALYGGMLVVFASIALYLATHREDWSYLETVLAIIAAVDLVLLALNTRRTIIGYEIYIGLTDVSDIVIKLWNPLEPPMHKYALIVNPATRRCSLVAGHKDNPNLLPKGTTICLTHEDVITTPWPLYLWYINYDWFINSSMQPPRFKVTDPERGEIIVKLSELTRLADEGLPIEIKQLFETLFAWYARKRTENMLQIMLNFDEVFVSIMQLYQASTRELEILLRFYKLLEALAFDYNRGDCRSKIEAIEQRIKELKGNK